MKQLAALALIGPLLASCTVFGIRSAEEAPHEVLAEDGNIQIRRYRAAIVAETVVDGNYDETGSTAFNRLGGYIFGKNKKRQKIAMTTPVVREETSEKIAMTVPVLQERSGRTWTMTFVMPAEYTLETLPEPLDPDVILREQPPRTVATIRYSGSLSEERIDAKAAELRAWLKENGYKAVSSSRSAGYDPPWTLAFLRRNEVHIDVE